MPVKFVFLSTDILLWLLLTVSVLLLLRARQSEPWQIAWHRITSHPMSIVSMMILSVFIIIALTDSIHYEAKHQSTSLEVMSVFDKAIIHLLDNTEKTYSEPFALHAYAKESIKLPSGEFKRDYPHLLHAGTHLSANQSVSNDVIARIIKGFLAGLLFTSFIYVIYLLLSHFRRSEMYFPWPLLFATLLFISCTLSAVWFLSLEYHVFGTDKVGNDVLYLTLKSIRTGIVIGTLTTLIMLPFSMTLGIMAGYFGGWIDDVIQYVYTVLSSVPGVLLIAASVLSLQVFINQHADWFPRLTERADAKLLALCAILGMTSWTSLCRLLRGETLKLREVDYVLAARSLGSSHFTILFRHILPNVFHLVLIAVVLDFSMLVLAEAVLSYVGVGVDPATISWGNMINSARLELAREPIVWWPLLAVFVVMFLLVLSANLFADAVRDGLDPRMEH